jgi:hypothetical protein
MVMLRPVVRFERATGLFLVVVGQPVGQCLVGKSARTQEPLHLSGPAEAVVVVLIATHFIFTAMP